MAGKTAQPPPLPGETLNRVERVAVFDGRIVLTFATVFALLAAASREPTGTIAGLLAAGAGAMELHGATRLREGNATGMKWLVRSQLGLLVVIVGYCIARLMHFDEALFARALTSEIEAQFREAGLKDEAIMPLFRTAYYATYVVVGCVTLFYQGAMARYYHRRIATVASDLA